MHWLSHLLKRDANPCKPQVADGPAEQAGRSGATALDVTAVAHTREGNALLDRGRFEEAAEQYRQAIQADALHVDAHVNLGFTFVEMRRPQEALAPLRRALVLAPASHDAHYLLGAVLLMQRALMPAIKHLERAISLKPDLLVAYRDLGKALHEVGQHDRAKSVLRAGIAVNHRFADLHYFLGNIELHEMKLDEALANYRRALAIRPDYAAVYSNMAPALSNLGDFKGAVAAARKALALDPLMHHARSNLLVALSCDAQCSPEDYLAEARLYGEVLEAHTAADATARAGTAPAGPAGASRRLRVGFVSGDLRSHPVGFFLENVLAHWNGFDMEAVAYSNHPSHDDLTARLQAGFGAWRDVSSLSDEAAARQIESDRIDVLIDLSGHTADNRLPLFARRPAPVQVSWLGYWASTGLPAIDHLLVDPISVPSDQRAHFTESLWYLPETRLCFTAPTGAGVPQVSAPPALHAGHITFGSFQRLTKLNDGVLGLWARVLRAVPGSRLRLQSAQMKDRNSRTQLLQRLAAAGIDATRVQLAEGCTRLGYLAAHAEIDILLDTFPHSGATTTCEALWMGVPTLTLTGTTMLARQGASLLTCAGLPEWIAGDEDDYVARAVRHASGLESLARLRTGLREQVAASPLFDAARFMRLFQEAVRGMWQQKARGLSVKNAASAQAQRDAPPAGLQ